MDKKISSMETPTEIPFGQHNIPTEAEFMEEAKEMLNLAKKIDKSVIFGDKEVLESKAIRIVEEDYEKPELKKTFSEILRSGQKDEPKTDDDEKPSEPTEIEKKFSWEDPECVERLKSIWDDPDYWEPQDLNGEIKVDFENCGEWFYCCYGEKFPAKSHYWPTKQTERAKPVLRRHRCMKKRYEKWTNKMIELGKIRGRRLAAKTRRKALEKKELERRKQVGEKTPKKVPGGPKNSKRK
ncbi:Oidioi.mRNA.OKI2018_I69.PAR.g10699.t1.cds [Oikopleura dioica]|uniref:Oidioi.mRNA.OKI2018_I69.PAR.g10699.t1.cds n=1 Tax=Oikopleura dioica TaxID=34765 RepID=A0ABN7RVD1_OIKDI|nr:Oidioi.mRNA.OKI2018_I69.PAR.g10699.t1.cds [Oikopleura dioica]